MRNNLVHPPKRIDEPEWPNHSELLEAWQLSTWYLELAVLRLLGYEGEYVSRLQLEGWIGDTEPVPWSTVIPLVIPPGSTEHHRSTPPGRRT